MPAILTTERLLLRRWRPSDRLPFEALNADPRVMEFMPGVLTPALTGRVIARIQRHFQQHGFGLFAAELAAEKSLIGFIGLSTPQFDAPFMPAPGSPRTGPRPWGVVEIGWRLAFDYWGRGLATEGARAVLRYAFTQLNLTRLVSFTVPANLRSRRVMEKLGMVHDPRDDFDHPSLPQGHPLRRHVLYRLERANWLKSV
ncbi:MAG: GNAT family N-acetyltransferase [Terracidiphilus sp.]